MAEMIAIVEMPIVETPMAQEEAAKNAVIAIGPSINKENDAVR